MRDQQKEVIQNYIFSYNHFDVAGIVRDLDEDVLFENRVNNKVTLRTEGLDAFRQQAEMATQYFQERKQAINSWEFNDSVVSIEIAYEALLAVDLPNGLKAGETLKLDGRSVFVFKGNKIIKITDES